LLIIRITETGLKFAKRPCLARFVRGLGIGHQNLKRTFNFYVLNLKRESTNMKVDAAIKIERIVIKRQSIYASTSGSCDMKFAIILSLL